MKIQYPGVAEAVETDLRNATMLLPLVKRLAPGLDAKALAAEMRERIGEELDYELEAQNQRRLARIFRGHPFIVVPEVVSSLSRERVLVSEFVSGAGFDAIKRMDQDVRDRVGEAVEALLIVLLRLLLGRRLGAQRVVKRLVDAFDAALQPLQVEAQIMRHRYVAALAGLDVGDGRQPVFELDVEAILRLARLQIEKTQDKRAGQAEQR